MNTVSNDNDELVSEKGNSLSPPSLPRSLPLSIPFTFNFAI